MKRYTFKDTIKILFRPPVISWALYDLANTSFAVVIITIIFPVYFTSIIASPEIYSRNFGDLMWGIASGTSMIIASLLAPVFGAIADTSRSKNKFFQLEDNPNSLRDRFSQTQTTANTGTTKINGLTTNSSIHSGK